MFFRSFNLKNFYKSYLKKFKACFESYSEKISFFFPDFYSSIIFSILFTEYFLVKPYHKTLESFLELFSKKLFEVYFDTSQLQIKDVFRWYLSEFNS